MPIFNKDGKVYVLEGPNPLVKEQVNWNPEKLTFHNFKWDEIKVKNNNQVKKIKKKQEIIKQEEVKQEEVKQEEQEKEYDLPYIKYKVLSYCSPAITETKKDSFYGESWTRVKYGNKMIFPSIIIEVNDFSFDFWTSDPKLQITEKSIIYPFAYEVHNQETDSYDKVPYDEYRWWKVIEKEKKEGGWLFKCVPSEKQPDFSD